MKTALGYIVLIGVVGGIYYLNDVTKTEDGKSVLNVAGELEIEVKVGKPEQRTIVRRVQAPGAVEPFTEVDISAEVVSKIIEMPVEEGDTVKAGDLLCRLDDADYRARIVSAKANVAKLEATIIQAEASFDKAKRDLERQKRLSESDATSALELADYHTTFIRAKASVDISKQELIQAQAMLVAAEDDLAKTVLTSPIDGIVSQAFAELGEVVITGTMNNPGTRVMVISDLSKMQVRCRVDESDAPLVKDGQTARIYLQSDMQTSIPGHVFRVATKGTTPIGRGVVTFETLVIVDSNDPRVKPGMTASVEIEVKRSENALTIPVEAVVNRKRRDLPEELVQAYDEAQSTSSKGEPTRKAEYLKTVFSIEDDKAVAHLVETGISDETHVEIISGLTPDIQLVVGPYRSLDSLKMGSKIKIEKSEEKDGDAEEEEGTERRRDEATKGGSDQESDSEPTQAIAGRTE